MPQETENTPSLIVWDFDGVLNANMVNGRPVWTRTLESDLGIPRDSQQTDLFAGDTVDEILRGRIDLLAHVSDWLEARGHPLTGRAFLDYWFEKDAYPDPEVLGWLRAHPARHVIGTNNETHRAAYIEETMGYGAHVETVFCSGRVGAAKTDPAFFARIEAWSGLPPDRILLVDDVAENIAAAEARGWQVFRFTDETRDALPARLGLA